MMSKTTLSSLIAEFETSQLDKSEFIKTAYELHAYLFECAKHLQTCDVNSILIEPGRLSFDISDQHITMECPEGETRVAPIETLNFATYETDVCRLLDYFGTRSSTIFDIGANIGYYTLRLAKLNPSAHIHAFEPLPESFDYLSRNLVINQDQKNVKLLNFGLSDKPGQIEFFIAEGNGTNASILNVAEEDSARRISGLVTTFDDYCESTGSAPDLIKCDVEGAELLVFKGGIKTLTKQKPVILTELLRKWSKPFGYHPNDVLSFFKNMGYLCLAINQDKLHPVDEVTEETAETNYLFVHKDKHKDDIQNLLQNT